MTAFLTWTAYGPLAAWGGVAVGERRTVDAQPSRSAIVGWLSAALGYHRTDADQIAALSQWARVAVLLENAGSLLSDFHTTQRPSATAVRKRVPTTRQAELEADGLGTTLSRREYSMDALCFVAVGGQSKPPVALEQLREALHRPVFEPYLGRKSCPVAWPLNAHVREADAPLVALEAQASDELLAQWLRPHLGPVREEARGVARLFWEGDWPGLDEDGVATRRDDPRDRQRWLFGERMERFKVVLRGGSGDGT